MEDDREETFWFEQSNVSRERKGRRLKRDTPVKSISLIKINLNASRGNKRAASSWLKLFISGLHPFTIVADKVLQNPMRHDSISRSTLEIHRKEFRIY